MSDGIQFTALELDALQEAMNIAFGQAAAALSEVIDMKVVLNVPRIVRVETEQIADYVREEIGDPAAFCMVEQFFFGRFSGTSFLLLPDQEGRKLIELFSVDPRVGPDLASESLASLERDIIVEIGNIIIGACVGKLAEILKDVVTYQPPRYLEGPLNRELITSHIRSSDRLALVFKTVFAFERQNIYGLLFLVTGENTAVWLKEAVAGLLEGIA